MCVALVDINYLPRAISNDLPLIAEFHMSLMLETRHGWWTNPFWLSLILWALIYPRIFMFWFGRHSKHIAGIAWTLLFNMAKGNPRQLRRSLPPRVLDLRQFILRTPLMSAKISGCRWGENILFAYKKRHVDLNFLTTRDTMRWGINPVTYWLI